MEKVCLVCKSQFHTPRKKSKYCSRECYFKSQIGKECPFKGNKIGKHKNHILSDDGRKKIIESNKKRVWTDEMREKLKKRKKPAWIFLRGENNPNWKEDKSRSEKLSRLRKTVAYEEWRKAVFERDNYTCQKCGDNRGGNLEADHIKPFAYFPKLRFEISNGRTLCNECHKRTDTYGHNAHKYANSN